LRDELQVMSVIFGGMYFMIRFNAMIDTDKNLVKCPFTSTLHH